MMNRKLGQRASSWVLLELVLSQSLLVVTVVSLSISTGGGGKNALKVGSERSVQHYQQQSATTLPPLMTTMSQISYLDALQAKHQQQQQQQQQQPINQQADHRLHSNEADDSVPLATINNHSKNNQPAARPPQYVDIAALVGRDGNLNSSYGSGGSLAATANSLSASAPTSPASIGVSGGSLAMSGSSLSSGSSGLSAKSRSGLPECATQQVCNAIFVRMNYTQRLCECSANFNWKCSHNLDPQDGHTIELTRKFDKRIYTQIKTCEPLREVRACKSPTDWTLLALQSERSGKAHYVVVCKCPTWAQLEGPYTHNHPPYANIPAYAAYDPELSMYPQFPWSEAMSILNSTNLVSTLDST